MSRSGGPERRLSERIPVIVSMHAYAYGVLVASGVVVDMSAHGLRLDVLEEYADDEIEPGRQLNIVMEDAAPDQRMPVLVVRKWDEGFAASFLGDDPQPF